MFNTDEVDVDLFTPASSTSLANIFKNTQVESEKDKATLKYIPEQPPAAARARTEDKPEDTKPTQCIYACTSYAYEWSNNAYLNKGKLGFALMKILKTGTHNFVLYDANKTTLSCATLTTTFEVHLRGEEGVCFSFYDNAQKYWTIYLLDKEIQKLLEILKVLNVTLKQCLEREDGPPKNEHASKDQNKNIDDDKENPVEDKTSDTDSSVNRKTKDSILKRMASMGQSVLPSAQTNIESTDSTDSNKSNKSCVHRRLSKHKQVKSYSSHSNTDKEFLDTVDGKVFVKKCVLKNKSYENTPHVYENPNVVIPCTSLGIINSIRDENIGISDVSLLISEQRVSNSELRMNMNRISDKLDTVMDKMKQTSTNDKDFSTTNYQNIIVQKLLNEYETKIKKYEEYIAAMDLEDKSIKLDKKKIIADDLSCKNISAAKQEKDIKISELKEEINKLTQQYDNVAEKEKNYLDEIMTLKREMEFKDEQLSYLNKKVAATSSNFQKSDDAKNKIKSLMNDTFQSIAANFTNEEDYSGAKVKNVVAAVIKKTTIEAISDL